MFEYQITQILNDIEQKFGEKSPEYHRIACLLSAVRENRCDDQKNCKLCDARCRETWGT